MQAQTHHCRITQLPVSAMVGSDMPGYSKFSSNNNLLIFLIHAFFLLALLSFLSSLFSFFLFPFSFTFFYVFFSCKINKNKEEERKEMEGDLPLWVKGSC